MLSSPNYDDVLKLHGIIDKKGLPVLLTAQDTDLVTPRELGKDPRVQRCKKTVQRWMTVGVTDRDRTKTVKLESIKTPGGLKTSIRAYFRMILALNNSDQE